MQRACPVDRHAFIARYFALAVGVGAAVALLAARVGAEPRATAYLEWKRAPGAERCSDVGVIEKLVEERLGRSVFVDAADADVAVRGMLEPNGHGFRAVVVLSHGKEELGVRALSTESTDCRELDTATALVLAVAIESVTVKRVELSLPKAKAKAKADPKPTSPAPRAPVKTRPPATTSSPEEPWRGELAAGGAFALGLLPKPAFGFVVGSVVTAPYFVPLEMNVSVWFPRDADLERGGASFSAWQAGIVVCPPFLSRPVAIQGCGGGSVGIVSAAGFGLDRNARATGALVDLALHARVTLPGGRFRPWLELGGEVPAIRDRFRVNVDGQAEELHRAAPVFFVARLGGLLAIP